MDEFLIALLVVLFMFMGFILGGKYGYQGGYCSALKSEYSGMGCVKGDKIIYKFK